MSNQCVEIESIFSLSQKFRQNSLRWKFSGNQQLNFDFWKTNLQWMKKQVLDFAMKLWTSLENSWKWLRRLYTSLKLTSNVPYAWICFKGDLLRGFDNCSGAWYKGLKVLWTTSFSNNFLYFDLNRNPIFTNDLANYLCMYGFYSESTFWKKSKCKKNAISNLFVSL